MNYVGFARKWDDVIFDGDPEAPPFIAYYLNDGTTVAAAGTHRDADLAAMHELSAFGARSRRTRSARKGGYSPVIHYRRGADAALAAI